MRPFEGQKQSLANQFVLMLLIEEFSSKSFLVSDRRRAQRRDRVYRGNSVEMSDLDQQVNEELKKTLVLSKELYGFGNIFIEPGLYDCS